LSNSIRKELLNNLNLSFIGDGATLETPPIIPKATLENRQWRETHEKAAFDAIKTAKPLYLSICNEARPFVSQDGDESWFTRTYLGSPGVFRSRRIDGEWGEPELIISQFAAEPSIDSPSNLYFTHHFFDGGKMIEADVHVAYVKYHRQHYR